MRAVPQDHVDHQETQYFRPCCNVHRTEPASCARLSATVHLPPTARQHLPCTAPTADGGVGEVVQPVVVVRRPHAALLGGVLVVDLEGSVHVERGSLASIGVILAVCAKVLIQGPASAQPQIRNLAACLNWPRTSPLSHNLLLPQSLVPPSALHQSQRFVRQHPLRR